VRYTTVVSTQDGWSRFEDIDVEMKSALAAKGVPPLLLSAPVQSPASPSSNSPKDPASGHFIQRLAANSRLF